METVQKVNLWVPNPNPIYVYVICSKETRIWIFAPFEIHVEPKEGYARVETWIPNLPLPESSQNYGELQFAFHLKPELKQSNRFEYLFMKLNCDTIYTIALGQMEFTGTPMEILEAYINCQCAMDGINDMELVLKFIQPHTRTLCLA